MITRVFRGKSTGSSGMMTVPSKWPLIAAIVGTPGNCGPYPQATASRGDSTRGFLGRPKGAFIGSSRSTFFRTRLRTWNMTVAGVSPNVSLLPPQPPLRLRLYPADIVIGADVEDGAVVAPV